MAPREFNAQRAIEAVRATGGDVTAAATRLGYAEATLRRRLQKAGLWDEVQAIRQGRAARHLAELPGVVENADGSLDVVSVAREDRDPPTVESLCEQHGIDLSEWVVTDVRPNSWEAMTSDKAAGDNRIVTLHQLKVHLVRKEALIVVPDPSGWTPPPKPKPRKRAADEPERGFVIGDHHAPHHDLLFHRLVLERLRERQPDFIEINGDLIDLPTVSRHRERDGYNEPINVGLAAALRILYDYRHVCPNARITLKRGNHDERLVNYLIDHARAVKDVAPGGGLTADLEEDARPWHDFRRLLHLDDLHIEYVDEPWDQAKTRPSRKLTLLHGFSTSENAGKAILDKLSGSTIQGHDHRLAMTMRTTHQPDGLEVRMAMSGGCACRVEGGLGYVTGGEPNWQNGAVELLVWPDGNFHATPIVYVDGQLLCPDKRYTA